MSKIILQCKNCKYYRQHKNQSYGICRYNPPRVIGYSHAQGDRGPMTFFPETLDTDWCGKHEQRRTKEAKNISLL